MARAAAIQETVREDGLRVITRKMPHTKKARVAVMSLVGSAYDPPGVAGLFHFFEHMAFEGTENIPREEMRRFKTRYTSAMNASTGPLDTVYFIEAFYSLFDVICKVLFDMYLHPLFLESSISKEKEVVLNEIAAHENHDGHTALYGQSRLLWRKNPLGEYGTGTPQGVESINRELLLAVHRKWHIPSSTVIIGTGRVDHNLLTEKAFAAFPLHRGNVEHITWSDECEELPQKTEIIIRRAGREQETISVGCKLPFLQDQDFKVLWLLSNILDSMLFLEVRQKHGLVYSIWCDRRGCAGLGIHLHAGAATLPGRIDQVKQLIFDIKCRYPLDREHFEDVKEGLKNHLLVSYEMPGEWEGAITDNVLNGENASLLNRYETKLIRNLSRISFEDVIAMREKFLRPERMVCAMVKRE